MKGFLNQNGHMVGKLFVYQIAISLLGVFVVSPFKGSLQLVAAVFSSLFYFSLVAYAVIEDGQKDYISVSAGRCEGTSLTGLYYSLISYIPTIVVVLLQVIINIFTDDASLMGLKSILTFVIRFFLMGMYLGFDTGLVQRGYDSVNQTQVILSGSDTLVFMSNNYLIFAICLVFLPLVAGVSYHLAFKGKVHVNTAPKNKK